MLYKKDCQICVKNDQEYVNYIITDLHTSFDDKFQPVRIPVHFVLNFKKYWSISIFLPCDDVMVTSYVN